jgi:hypothetical protein
MRKAGYDQNGVLASLLGSRRTDKDVAEAKP